MSNIRKINSTFDTCFEYTTGQSESGNFCYKVITSSAIGQFIQFFLYLSLLVFCCLQQVCDSHHCTGGSRRRRTGCRTQQKFAIGPLVIIKDPATRQPFACEILMSEWTRNGNFANVLVVFSHFCYVLNLYHNCDSTTIRRYHDAFDYDGSDRNYEGRSKSFEPYPFKRKVDKWTYLCFSAYSPPLSVHSL